MVLNMRSLAEEMRNLCHLSNQCRPNIKTCNCKIKIMESAECAFSRVIDEIRICSCNGKEDCNIPYKWFGSSDPFEVERIVTNRLIANGFCVRKLMLAVSRDLSVSWSNPMPAVNHITTEGVVSPEETRNNWNGNNTLKRHMVCRIMNCLSRIMQ